jgi:ATP-dependent Clp protease ATP-binding subunit ClpA
MDMNRLTQRSQEALQEAQSIAIQLGQTEVDVEHLLRALIADDDGLAPRVRFALRRESGLERLDVGANGLQGVGW